MDDPRRKAEAALARLIRDNAPGKVSLAGAYALGYGALGMAQQEGDQPPWYDELDPLDALFLGTVWPQGFRDGYEFGNARAAWLRLLRGTAHWPGIERFVREVLAASEEHDLPVDEGELMLLLAGRLEATGLAQRKLPRELLPDRALAGARLAYGPPEDVSLPDPPPDAPSLVAALRGAVSTDLPGDGTASDALREGLHMLGNAGLDVHADSAVLLPALYAGLVARSGEDLSEVGERAVAWALGLATGSPLVPVTDALMVAAERGLSPDATLAHLFAIPAFTQPVSAEDRRWLSWPGTELTGLAFELGYAQVITRNGKTVRLGQDEAAMLATQCRRFEEKFGRPPGPSDPVFFDPDAGEPRPVALTGLETATVGMLEAAGISPAWIYAYQHTGGLLPRLDGSFASERDRTEWDEAVARHIGLHQPASRVDHDAETRKLQGALVIATVQMAAEDPDYGATLAAQLDPTATDTASEAAVLREHLRAWAAELTGQLHADTSVRSLASEYGRAWAGAELAGLVRDAAGSDGGGASIDDRVLLAAAAALIQQRQE